MKAIITVGVSGSGKSTFAKQQVSKGGWFEINRDLIRQMLLQGELVWKNWKWKREDEVTDIVKTMIEYNASKGRNIILSDTNLNFERRKNLAKQLKSLGYDVEVKVFHVKFFEALRRDTIRPNGVGSTVLARQFEQYNKEFVDQYFPDPSKDLKPAIIVDVDGTLAEMYNRGPFEWDKVDTDRPKQLTIDIVKAMSATHTIIVMSGRDSCSRALTEAWLNKHQVPYDELYMRAEGDSRPDAEIKLELFWNNVADRYKVVGVFDDRPVMVLAWRSIGLETFALGNQYINF